MAKKVIAVTTIIHDGETIKPGEELPYEKFNKDQLTRLYERGAVRVEMAEEATEVKFKNDAADTAPPKDEE